jgi:hypothetical protein
MSKYEDFDLDEGALWVLCPSARKMIMKKIENVDRLRRERRGYLEQAEKAHGIQKAVLENYAERCKEAILPLMEYVWLYEHGRLKRT